MNGIYQGIIDGIPYRLKKETDLSFLTGLHDLKQLDLTAINPDDKKVFVDLVSLRELVLTDTSLSRDDVRSIMIWLKDCHVVSNYVISDEELNRGRAELDTDSDSDTDTEHSDTDTDTETGTSSYDEYSPDGTVSADPYGEEDIYYCLHSIICSYHECPDAAHHSGSRRSGRC